MPWPFGRKSSSSTTKAASPAASVLMSGWITRQAKKEWKRRYYVLRTDGALSYYKTNTQQGSAKPVLTIDPACSIDVGKGNRFTIIGAGVSHLMYCDTADSSDRWVTALRATIAGSPESCVGDIYGTRRPSVDSSSATMPNFAEFDAPASPTHSETAMDTSATSGVSFTEQLHEVLRRPENKLCADCNGPAPTWASWNLGILLCVNCAGVHRGLGVHISKVRSIHLDHWSPSQIQGLQEQGNAHNKRVYEISLPADFSRPRHGIELKRFIQQKYIEKRFALAPLFTEVDAPSIQRSMSTVSSMPRPVFIRGPSTTSAVSSSSNIEARGRCASMVFSRDSDSKLPTYGAHAMLEDDMHFFEAVSALSALPPAPGTRASRVSKDRLLLLDPFSRSVSVSTVASPTPFLASPAPSTSSTSMFNHRSVFADAYATAGITNYDDLPGSQSEF